VKVRVKYDMSPWAATTIFKQRTLVWASAIAGVWASWLWGWWAIIPVTLIGLARIGHGQWLVNRAGPIVPPISRPSDVDTGEPDE
jgi:hypothetical protein